MTSIKKPGIAHPSLAKNELGLTVRDYEGSMSTLCAGCGHDSVTAAIVRAFYELSIPPHRVAKLSGIGRMPAIATGANAANQELTYIGISGDGDSLSIGLGQLCHAVRRNVRMLYVIENNGVYGLTKGQFSASSDVGSKSKRGEPNQQRPIDPAMLALSLGATFVARSFSGDKEQLIPILKAGLSHRGLALVDVLSPCVTFNDHEGSTKSYAYTRKHRLQVVQADFVPPAEEIEASYDAGKTIMVRLHDGLELRLSKVAADYDPTDRVGVYKYLEEQRERGLVPTGLLYLDPSHPDMHGLSGTVGGPLTSVPFAELCPGKSVLDSIQEDFR
jgi:2-oxoglutarate ferredoxin oxidoreductase subunit beta